MHARLKNRSGIIMMVALWIMGLLSILAIGLGKRTSIDIALTRNSLDKITCDFGAWAGVSYAMAQLKKDSLDPVSVQTDSLYQCGIKLEEGQTPDMVFKDIPVKDVRIEVGYRATGAGQNNRMIYGLADEERFINLNAISEQNYKVLSALIVLLGFDEQKALMIASSVIDWHDPDSTVSNVSLGAEDTDYMSLPKPYHCKNLPFESVNELLLVKGMTTEIYSKIKDYVTVFPQESTGLMVNLETAPEPVIRALAKTYSGAITNTEETDADSLTDKILSFRRGEDGVEASKDDRSLESNDMALNAKENVIFSAMKTLTTSESRYFRMNIRAKNPSSGMQSRLETVLFRDDLTIVYWNRN